MRIYLVRHGQSTNNAGLTQLEDPPLTPMGRKQIQRVAKWLLEEPEPIHWLLTSPLLRAQQSAAILEKALQVEPEIWTDLQEYDSQQESREEMWQRAQGVAERIRKLLGAREVNNLVVITHLAFGSRLLCALTNTSPHTRFTHFHGGISLLEWDEGGILRVRYTNSIMHLSKEMISL